MTQFPCHQPQEQERLEGRATWEYGEGKLQGKKASLTAELKVTVGGKVTAFKLRV